MTVLTAPRPKNLLERLSDKGTVSSERNGAKKSHMVDSTRSSTESLGARWGKEDEDRFIANYTDLISTNFSFFDFWPDLEEVSIEATSTAESIALWVGRILSAANDLPANTNLEEVDFLLDAMLPRMPLSIEPIRLQVEFVEPRFQWSNEIEIDPLDELD